LLVSWLLWLAAPAPAFEIYGLLDGCTEHGTTTSNPNILYETCGLWMYEMVVDDERNMDGHVISQSPIKNRPVRDITINQS
jgi:hypothetical protein